MTSVAYRAVEPARVLERPRASLKALDETDRRIRHQYIESVRRAAADSEARDAQRKTLVQSVDFLELNLAMAGLVEAVVAVGVTSIEAVAPEAERIARLAEAMTELDIPKVFERFPALMKLAASQGKPELKTSLPEMERGLVETVRLTVAAAPITDLLRWAEELNLPELRHRCKSSYERLQALFRRHTPEHDAKFATAGQAYAEGRVSLDEVSTVLGIPKWDASAWLEKHGYCRTLDGLRLTDDARNARLAIIDRERTTATIGPSRNLVSRDVIATQRIEGVDARPWVRPEQA